MEREVTLSIEKLRNLLRQAYTDGYRSHDTIEAGLEPFDPDTCARYIINTQISKHESNNV